MEGFFIFVLIVALIIVIIVQSERNKKINQELINLRFKLNDLNEKTYFMYDCLKRINAVPGLNQTDKQDSHKKAASVQNDVWDIPDNSVGVENAAQADSAQVHSNLRTSVPPVVPEIRDNAVVTAASVQSDDAQDNSDVRSSVPAAVPDNRNNAAAAAVRNDYEKVQSNLRTSVPPVIPEIRDNANIAAASVQPDAVQGQNIQRNSPPPFVPAAGYAAPNAYVPQQPVKPKRNLEEWLGARLFNIAASVMIFIGLILFCTLSADVVTNSMKMIALFVVSGGFIAVGAFLARKDKSIFPLGMLGCGFGSFFISILLSHVYFHSLGEIPAFGLILLWSALALFMSKRLDSVMLSVTAHIGTAVSICFAYSLGFTPEKVITVTIYQMAALAVLIIGNIFCCRKTYRFGLIMSQCLLAYTSIAMTHAFSSKFIMADISVAVTIAVYAIQFAAISFISYLVAVSASALEKQKSAFVFSAAAVHSINKILWTVGTIASVGCITYFICLNAFKTTPTLWITAVLCTAGILHLCLTIVMEEKLGFSEQLSTISIGFVSALIAGALFVGAHDTGMPFIFVYVLVLTLLFKLTKHKGIPAIAMFVLFIEGAYLCCYGYFEIENVWISIPYMVGVGVTALLLWFAHSGEDKQRYFKLMKITEYIWISASIIPINASEFSEISIPLILSEFALMNIICRLIHFARDNEPDLKTVVKAESLLTVYIGILSLTFESTNDLGRNNIIKAVLVIMIAIITLIFSIDFARNKHTALQVLSAITIASYVSALSLGFSSHFSLFDIYTYELNGHPSVFIFGAVIIAIYALNRNHKLQVFIWASIILDMLYMGFLGYGDLIEYVEFQEKHSLHILITGISIAHAAALLGASFLINALAESDHNTRITKLSRFVSFYWINLSFPVITYCAFMHTNMSSYKMTFALIVLAVVNTAVFALNYQGEEGSAFNTAVRITSSIAFYAIMPFLSGGKRGEVGEYAACIVLMAASAALFFVISRELLKIRSAWVQVYIGITSTIFINCVCNGLSRGYDFASVFSIVTMITALLCIIAGFIAKAKGLRIYGLIVVMICIIKLVTADISSADSLERVLAFVIGGIVCFIISGIYNRVEKKLSASDVQPQTPVLVNSFAQAAPVMPNMPVMQNAAAQNPYTQSFNNTAGVPVSENIPVQNIEPTPTQTEIKSDPPTLPMEE